MTSSVRGLFVGGKSTGNNNRQQGRRTAPAAMNQAAGRPVDPPDIEVPTLSPQASMQVTVLQAEKQEMAKRAQFSPYIAPKRNDDLGKLATSLRNFSSNIETLVETGVQFEKQENDRAKEHAEALAAQGMAYGPFKDYADLTRNLDRVIADPNTSEPERQQAQFLLTELRARSNRIVPHIASQARILRVTQNAMGLSIAAQANPVVGKDDEGNDVLLHDIDANDPRFLQWQNQHIYGDVQLTPAEFKSVRGVIQQATLNNMSKHNTTKVAREEDLYVQQFGAEAEQLGYNHFVRGGDIQYGQETRRRQVQDLLDQPAFLGLSADARKKAQNMLYNRYLAGVQRADAPAADYETAAEVFENTDANGNRVGVYIGPVNDRKKADGTPNAALLWSSTQAPNWRIQSLKDATQLAIDADELASKAAKQDAYYGSGDTPGLVVRETEILERLFDPDTRVQALKDMEVFISEIQANESIPADVRRDLIKDIRGRIDGANEATYKILYDKTYNKHTETLSLVTNEVISVAEARKRIEDDSDNLRPAQKALLLKRLETAKDPIVKQGQEYIKNQIDTAKQQAEADYTNLNNEDRQVLQRSYLDMQRQYTELLQERNLTGMKDDEFRRRFNDIRLSEEASKILGRQRTFAQSPTRFRDYTVDTNTGEMITNPDPKIFNRQFNNGVRAGKVSVMNTVYRSPTERLLPFNALLAISAGYVGYDSKGYRYETFVDAANRANIDPLDYLIKEHEKALMVANLYSDEGSERRISFLEQSLEMLRKRKARQVKEVSVVDPVSSARKIASARDTSQFLVNLLLPAEPAAAATMDIPPPPPPVEAANFKLSGPNFIRISEGSKQQAVAAAASKVGIHPASFAAVMSFETGGTMDPSVVNSLGYVGLVQFGKWEQGHYRVNRNTPFEEQAMAAAQYLIDRGVKPGDGIERIYAAVLIGNADGKLSDGSDGMDANDAYGNSVNKVLKQMQPGGAHYKKAVRFLTGA